MSTKLSILSLTLAIFLSACGGGGGGGSADSNTATTSTSSTSTTQDLADRVSSAIDESQTSTTQSGELNDNSSVALGMPNLNNDATTPLDELKK